MLDFLLAPGQAHELAPSLTLLRRLPDTPSWVLADRACDAAAFRTELRAAGAIPVVPSRQGAKDPQPCPDYIYHHRNLIERCWSRLKERRAVATRYDKTAASYGATVAIAASLDWIKSAIGKSRCEHVLNCFLVQRLRDGHSGATARLMLLTEQPPALPRPGGKLGVMIDLLAKQDGANADELVAGTGWQRHSMLGVLSRLRARALPCASTPTVRIGREPIASRSGWRAMQRRDRSGMAPSSCEQPQSETMEGVAAAVAALAEMAFGSLQAEWRRVYRTHPPRKLSRDLLQLAVAWKLQARLSGGLSARNKRKLAELADVLASRSDLPKARRISLKPGARIVRRWGGETHEVVAAERGFIWRDVSQSLIKQGRPKAPGAAARGPAANLEGLVETRLRNLLRDPAAIYEVARAVSTDTASRKALLAAVADLGSRWHSRSAAERRAMLGALVGRVTAGTEAVDIEVGLGALPELVQVDATQVRANHDLPPMLLSVPTELKRTGIQNQLLIDRADTSREPDRSLLPFAGSGPPGRAEVMAGRGKEMRELAVEAGVNPSYFARIFRLPFLAPAISHAILQGRQPSDLTANRLELAGRLPANWSDQRRQFGLA